MASKQKRTLELRAVAKDKTATAFKRMNARAQLFGLRMKKVAAGITRGFFSLRGALVGLGAALGFKKLIDDFDDLNKRARRLNLPVDEFNELGFSAKLAGVGTERFNSGLRFLQTRVLDAVNGNQQLLDVFEKFNVALTDTDGNIRSTGSILEDFADGYKALPEGIERSALATKVLGEETSAMSTLLEGGSAGLRQMRKEAAFFEGSVEGLGSKAEDFNDSLTRLGASLKSVFRKGAIEVADKLTGVFNNLAVFIAKNRGAIVGFFVEMGRAATAFFELTVTGFSKILSVLARTKLLLTGALLPWENLADKIAETRDKIAGTALIMENSLLRLEYAREAGDTIGAERIEKGLEKSRKLQQAQKVLLSSLTLGTGFTQSVGLFAQTFEELYAKFLNGTSGQNLGLVGPMNVLKKDVKETNEELSKQLGFFDGIKNAGRGALLAISDSFAIGQELAGNFFRTIEDGATNEVASLIQGTQRLSQTWQNFGRVFAQIMAQMIARLLVIKAIQFGLNFLIPGAGAAAGAAAGGAGGSLFGGGGAGAGFGAGAANGATGSIQGGAGPNLLGSRLGGGGGGLNLTLHVTQNIQHPDGEALARANRGQADSLAEIVVQKLTERPELSAAVRGA